MLSIARCRELLGRAAESMTDEEIVRLRTQYEDFGRAFLAVCDDRERAARRESVLADASAGGAA